MRNRLQRFYRKVRYGRPVIVVSGLPRSGTSMAMKMLAAAGVPVVTDGVRRADEDNPRGYYEDERVKNLAATRDHSWVRGTRGRAVKVISYLLRHLPTDNNYKVIFLHRTLEEVLASQAKMLERREEEHEVADERMREAFEADLWRARYLLRKAPQFEVLELHYREVLADPRAAAGKMSDFLGLELDVERMTAVVDPDLYRNRAEELAAGGVGIS